jgi:tRNA(Ile)-lysidine synthase
MAPDPALADRFRIDLDDLVAPGARVGLAVSGGPDSLALLLLAAAARPALVEAATIDHALRAGSAAEAKMVAELCATLNVPHAILNVQWPEKPAAAVQERARSERYALLSRWAEARGLAAILAAHHAVDQAETVMMRLVRGAGVSGLAGMRGAARAPGGDTPLLRPLLGWRRGELEQICAAAGVAPVVDPSNSDAQFERVRMRDALASADWLDPAAVARSAGHLAQADAAIAWAADLEWQRAVTQSDGITYRPTGAPAEILRRIARRAVLQLASEGQGADLRGAELDRLLSTLQEGGKTTLRGVLCSGGREWRFALAPRRK